MTDSRLRSGGGEGAEEWEIGEEEEECCFGGV
jgi:hypothetical protein